MSELSVDPHRRSDYDETGIYIRAKYGNEFISVDIAELDKESLLFWLRSGGGDNPLAENVVGILLGHGHLHTGHNLGHSGESQQKPRSGELK